MSQHIHQTTCKGVAVDVIMGWDRRLSHFHMTVVRTKPPRRGDGVLYSNLHERNAFALGLEDYAARLANLGISVPTSLIDAVRQDQADNAGNRVLRYLADGSVAPEPDQHTV